MKIFRINLYLSIKNFIIALFLSSKKVEKKIIKSICKSSKKKYFVLTSQLRVSFLILLKYLTMKYPKKNEIIFSSYNLAEMVNVSKNLKYKVKFCDLNYDNGFFNIKILKKKITKKTLAIVQTNMFNSYEDSYLLRNLCKKRGVILIEDNAIFFDNYKKIKNKKIFSGTLGNYSLYSFNIMKNISALFGGGVSTNDKYFENFAKKEIDKFKEFHLIVLLKQILIFLILKLLSSNFLYKVFFFNIVKYAHLNNSLFLLKIFYPSLKFTNRKFPDYYFTKISNISKKLVYLQIKDLKTRRNNHKVRASKNKYYVNKFNEKKIKEVKLFPIKDFNYQNPIDFPIIVKNKIKLNEYLLKCGIETRTIYYRNCNKIFNIKGRSSPVAEKYEKEIICLPNHVKVNNKYIDYIVNKIFKFYDRKL